MNHFDVRSDKPENDFQGNDLFYCYLVSGYYCSIFVTTNYELLVSSRSGMIQCVYPFLSSLLVSKLLAHATVLQCIICSTFMGTKGQN